MKLGRQDGYQRDHLPPAHRTPPPSPALAPHRRNAQRSLRALTVVAGSDPRDKPHTPEHKGDSVQIIVMAGRVPATRNGTNVQSQAHQAGTYGQLATPTSNLPPRVAGTRPAMTVVWTALGCIPTLYWRLWGQAVSPAPGAWSRIADVTNESVAHDTVAKTPARAAARTALRTHVALQGATPRDASDHRAMSCRFAWPRCDSGASYAYSDVTCRTPVQHRPWMLR